MLVNNQILIICQKLGFVPSLIENDIANPNVKNVFSCLFFFMYNGIQRELVNEYYCEYIAGDVLLDAETINMKLDFHSRKGYFDLKQQRTKYPDDVDVQEMYHVYTPFWCRDWESIGASRIACLDPGTPELFLYQVPEFSELVTRDQVIQLKYLLTANTYDDRPIEITNFRAQGFDVVSHDPENKLITLAYKNTEQTARFSASTTSNCLGSGFHSLAWDYAPTQRRTLGPYIICEGDPPYDTTSEAINDFPDSDISKIKYEYRICGGEWRVIDLNTPPQGFTSLVPTGNGNFTITADTVNPVCNHFNRHYFRSTYMGTTVFQNELILDHFPFRPTVIPYSSDGSNYLNEAPLYYPFAVQPGGGEVLNQYWVSNGRYVPGLVEQSTGDIGSGFEFEMYYDPFVVGDNEKWGFQIYGDLKTFAEGVCPETFLQPWNMFPGTAQAIPVTEEVIITIRPVEVFIESNRIEEALDGVLVLLGDPITLTSASNPKTFHNVSYNTNFFAELDLKILGYSYASHLIKFQYKCSIVWVLLKLKPIQEDRILVRSTLPNVDHRRCYDVQFMRGDLDVSDSYDLVISSNVDGRLPIYNTGLCNEIELPSVGPHIITLSGVPKVQPSLRSPSTTREELFNPPSFNICFPEPVGTVLDTFRDDFENSPCKAESDAFRVATGLTPWIWSDHLAYAALMQAVYLGENGVGDGHRQVLGKPYFYGETVGIRASLSGFKYFGIAEGFYGGDSFCDFFLKAKLEYTDNMDPLNAGHFGPWVKPPTQTQIDNEEWSNHLGMAWYDGFVVMVYGRPRSITKPVPVIPPDINQLLSSETKAFTVNAFFLQTCLVTTVDPPSHPVVDWYSDIDGHLGTFESISNTNTSLSPGTHTITVSYYHNGLHMTDTTTLVIDPVPILEVVVFSDTNATTFTLSDAVGLADVGTATWSSDLVGALTSGAVLSINKTTGLITGTSVQLAVGTHVLTAKVLHNGVEYTKTVSYIQIPPPALTLTKLTTYYNDEYSVTAKHGNVASTTLSSWSSSIDGLIGEFSQFSYAITSVLLSLGTHTITCTDIYGQSTSIGVIISEKPAFGQMFEMVWTLYDKPVYQKMVNNPAWNTHVAQLGESVVIPGVWALMNFTLEDPSNWTNTSPGRSMSINKDTFFYVCSQNYNWSGGVRTPESRRVCVAYSNIYQCPAAFGGTSSWHNTKIYPISGQFYQGYQVYTMQWQSGYRLSTANPTGTATPGLPYGTGFNTYSYFIMRPASLP